MKLNNAGIRQADAWESKGYRLPACDLDAVRARTLAEPAWLHFGAGNLLRAFPAAVLQNRLDSGAVDKGLILVEGFDEEIVHKVCTPHDSLGLVVTLGADGSMQKRVVGSVVRSIAASEEREALEELFRTPSLQMVSFTITEKGYQTHDAQGNWLPWVKEDLDRPDAPASLMGLVAHLCFVRYQAGELPLALVSMDNCSRNGDILQKGVRGMAAAWAESGAVPQGFLGYLDDPEKISFPWSMIDKITPRPSDTVAKALAEDGFEDTGIVVTAKNSYVAPFVNTETAQYLAIEDHFPNGRPPLEGDGILFCDRETVDRIEKMKVRTALNPLHTVLAIYGCLLGYTSIAAEMRDPQLKTFITRLGYEELMPMVVDPGVINPRDFIAEVIGSRFPNPFIPDTPQRIACDTSQKIPVRFGETLAAYASQDPEALAKLRFVPLFIAGWLRYLCGTGDDGQAMELSPDPMLEELRETVSGISLGQTQGAEEALRRILSNSALFGVDLCAQGMAEEIVALFYQLNAGPGAVRRTLEEYCVEK